MEGIVLAAAGKKGGKKKGISAMSAFQMLDIEEPDMSEVRETLLGFDFTVICLFFFEQYVWLFLLAIGPYLTVVTSCIVA